MQLNEFFPYDLFSDQIDLSLLDEDDESPLKILKEEVDKHLLDLLCTNEDIFAPHQSPQHTPVKKLSKQKQPPKAPIPLWKKLLKEAP